MNDTATLPPVVEPGVLAKLAESEIQHQVATAHRFPRSLTKFQTEMRDMVTLDAATAAECMYSLPRDSRAIIGPSARFAEIVASAWGNNRSGARIVDMTGGFITAQGVFHDLERNVAVTIEVQRRITDKSGRRFKDDMIAVTGNAAVSIALRNAVLKGVPKGFWSPAFDDVQRTIRGDIKTLADRRALALEFLQKSYSVSAARVCDMLGVPGIEDIGLDELLILKGTVQSLRDGETTVDQLFPEGARTGSASLNEKLKEHDRSEDAAAEKADVQQQERAQVQQKDDDGVSEGSKRKPRAARKPKDSEPAVGDTPAQAPDEQARNQAVADSTPDAGSAPDPESTFDFGNIE